MLPVFKNDSQVGAALADFSDEEVMTSHRGTERAGQQGPPAAEDQGGRVRAADLWSAGDRQERASTAISTRKSVRSRTGRIGIAERRGSCIGGPPPARGRRRWSVTPGSTISRPTSTASSTSTCEAGQLGVNTELDSRHREQGRGRLPPVQQGC